MRVALLLVASAHAFVRPTLHALRSPTQRPALSPEMAGAIAKAKDAAGYEAIVQETMVCLLYTSPSPRDKRQSRMPSSA